MILDRILRNDSSHSRQIRTSEDLDRYLRERVGTSAAGIDVTPERSLQLSSVFACVRVLAEEVGQLPLHLYRKRGREVVKAEDHPLYSVLHDNPNDYMTAQEWLEWQVACLALRGNAYAQINRVRGKVMELLPFNPNAVIPKRFKGGHEVYYEVRLEDGQPEELGPSEVLHVKLLPLDGFVGANPVAHAREAVGLAIAAEQFGGATFKNGATPGGVLEHPGTLDDPEYERVKSSWEVRHSGSENAGKIAILEGGMKFNAIGFPAKDAQFLETRKYQRSEICGIYRVPPHLIGDLERATFSNIEQQSLDFVVHGLMPYLRRIEQRITLQLLSSEERREFRAKFNAAGLLRGDMASRGAFYQLMVNMGAFSPNEVREKEDLNPREGGDVYLTPSNMLIDGKAPAPAQPPETQPARPADPADPAAE